MKNSLLGFRHLAAPLALLVFLFAQPVIAATPPSNVNPSTATVVQAPTQLAWDRVGSPIQIRA